MQAKQLKASLRQINGFTAVLDELSVVICCGAPVPGHFKFFVRPAQNRHFIHTGFHQKKSSAIFDLPLGTIALERSPN
jgi:hypothetical protein